jgi:roadblock/LC7 domain-containing protein
MAVMARESWTDERLDDLNHRVDSGFSEVSREFQAIRLEMRTEFAAVRSEMRTEFAAVRSEMATMRAEANSQFAAQNRMAMQLFGGMFATMAVGFLGTIATIIAQT